MKKNYLFLFLPLLVLVLLNFLPINNFEVGRKSNLKTAKLESFSSKLESASNFPIETRSERISELETKVLNEGTLDTTVNRGDKINVNYRGWLATNGEIFDESFKNGSNGFTFNVGSGVITGWSEGVLGMKVSEVRRLYIPADLAYGASGSGSIPADADLIFDVELVSIN